MSIKNYLKNNKRILRMYSTFLKNVTMISPELSTKITYFISKGTSINLKNPVTIEEKISWLKLNDYSNNPLVIQCADKLNVRDYVNDMGHGDTLNELLQVYENLDEIIWEELPNQFALKWTTGAGGNFICYNKNKVTMSEIKEFLNLWKVKWDKHKPYLSTGELQYSHIKPKIILEKHMGNEISQVPVDYKVYCFNGQPKAILVMGDRGAEIKGVFMSPEWDFISNVSKYEKFSELPEKPNTLERMVGVATDLSQPFPFVRVDFYDGIDTPVFGEMTFTPAGGISLATTEIDGVPMGNYLKLNLNKDEVNDT